MYYTIYKVTNKINGKFYIGKHQTKNLDDGYMGSGNLIKRAIKKYGIDNFTKEILHVFQTEEEMSAKEKELVIVSEESYNLCEGGKGGFGYINKNGPHNIGRKDTEKTKKLKSDVQKIITKNMSTQDKEKISIKIKTALQAINYNHKNFYGRKHTEETKRKMSQTKKKNRLQFGNKNSQYGTFWITNGVSNKKTKDIIMDGWYKGRTLKQHQP